jgi:DNA-binding transcriptional LysR family regulator
MLESRQLRYFVAVAQHLHFGRAADDLGIAQSALSRHLQQFEKSLGIRLLNRGRRSTISLTASGQAFLIEATAGIRQLERARTAAQRAARGQTGKLAIGYVASAAFSGVLPRALERFRSGFSDVSVELSAMETPAQLTALGNGMLDVGFLRARSEYPDGITASVVQRDGMLLALADSHPLARKRIDLSLLSEQTFIIPQFDENTGFAEHVAALASHGGFEPKKILRVHDFLTALSLAAAGYGVVPAPHCVTCLAISRIVFKRIQGYDGMAELVVAHQGRPGATVAGFIAATRAARVAESKSLPPSAP